MGSLLPDAAAADIVLASQKDDAHLAELRSSVLSAGEALFGPQALIDHSHVLCMFADTCYYGLTIGLGRQTLGEEFCDLLSTTLLESSLRQRLGLTLALAGFPLCAAKLEGLMTRRRFSLVSQLAGTLAKLHSAMFFWLGDFLDPVRRLFQSRLLFTREPLVQRPSYRVLSVFILVQLALRLGAWAVRKIRAALAGKQAAKHEATLVPSQMVESEGAGWMGSCGICLSTMTSPACPPCGHCYCYGCIMEACISKNECPTCRQQALPQNGHYSKEKILIEVFRATLEFALIFATIKIGSDYMMNRDKKPMDPKKTAKAAQRKLATASGSGPIHERRAKAVFNDYEDTVAGDMIFPDEIDVSFSQIGGVGPEKREIFDLVCLPLQRPELFSQRASDLLQPPRGILLYGPPGTGKTMMAKAIAKESGAAFINLKLSTTMNMWFGESQKIVRASFSLARKLAPSIIFIDEIDAFLRERRSDDNAASANMKAEFMALWDGIGSDEDTDGYGVIVIGATNRPFDVDPAILRRLPRSFEIGLPDAQQREEILRLTLRNELVALDLQTSLPHIARDLDGYSGSDLKELCRAAVTRPFRELVHAKSSSNTTMRALTLGDFAEAQLEVKPTADAAALYRDKSRPNAAGSVPSSHAEQQFLEGVKYGMTLAKAMQEHEQANVLGNNHQNNNSHRAKTNGAEEFD